MMKDLPCMYTNANTLTNKMPEYLTNGMDYQQK